MMHVLWLCSETVMKKNTARDRNWQMFISYCISTSNNLLLCNIRAISWVKVIQAPEGVCFRIK